METLLADGCTLARSNRWQLTAIDGSQNKMNPFKKSSTRLVALCSAAYFISYLTRKTYEASILSICDDTGLARTAAGLAGTAAVALYGSG